MTDFATQRKSMVDSQVRPSDVTDRRLPRAMLAVPREAFVPDAARAIAYRDDDLRVTDGPGGRYLLAPRTLAKLIQSLNLPDSATVLDIGAATGYSTAVLAQFVRRVVAVEADPVLAERLMAAMRGNAAVKVVVGAHAAGSAAAGPFDGILLNGAVPEIPRALLDQLKDGGRLACVLMQAGVGKATLWQRFGTRFDQRTLFDAGAPMLPGFERPLGFVF